MAEVAEKERVAERAVELDSALQAPDSRSQNLY